MSEREALTFDLYRDYCVDSAKLCIAGSFAMAVLGKMSFIIAPVHGSVFAVSTVSWWLAIDKTVDTCFPDFNPTDPELPIGYNIALTVIPLALSTITTTYVVYEIGSLFSKKLTYSDIVKPSIVDCALFFGWTHFYVPEEEK